MVEFDLLSARFAPVKYLFNRKGLVRVSIGKPENELTETCVDNAIEVALPFIDDFSQSPEQGDRTELEVRRPFPFKCWFSISSDVVNLPARKSGKIDLRTHLANSTCQGAPYE